MIAPTPTPPYFAVIFTSVRTEGENGYTDAAERMAALAAEQPGFLGVESARNEVGITVSYWESLDAIRNWKQNAEHLLVQEKGREVFYSSYKTRICKVERDYEFEK
ncbi:MAG: antibiotic biosynthesis monooxygenase [Chitinophagaceae bacterium]|nr:antibiotic biosynthesis monooxygenase [Chitinophagaceae bacterium]